eukprot:c9176_g1_i1.p1 GENE.c9176_g1_i1~~c9176_g1_i1.p1  ORF type:complete len:759 (-),score=222.72 c9176_g1_i1:63-2339(-)
MSQIMLLLSRSHQAPRHLLTTARSNHTLFQKATHFTTLPQRAFTTIAKLVHNEALIMNAHVPALSQLNFSQAPKPEGPNNTNNKGTNQSENNGTGNDNKGGGNNNRPRLSLNDVLMTAVILGTFMLLPSGPSMNPSKEISFQEFLSQYFAEGKVERLIVDVTGRVFVILKSPTESGAVFFTIGSPESFERKLFTAQREMGIDPHNYVKVTYKQENVWVQEIIKLLPTLAIIAIIYAIFVRGARQGKGGKGGMGGLFDMGKAKPVVANKDGRVSVTFKDVAGLYEAKEEVMEFVHFLRTPEKYERLGAKLPKGALLVGPPGTGKTLLAKAMAGEAAVPFFSVSGSDFVEMFVGVGASRVRDLFDQARENAPCIVFIDEIDAVGRARSEGGFSGGNDERENTLNQLLVEMDGFNTKQGAVVVLAGTNRPDILDKALLRPGRFDRQITIDKPDQKGRVEIFQVHLKPLKLDVEDSKGLVERLSALTPGFSGADIANVCNEAALIAARRSFTAVKVEHFEAAIERILGGLEKKTKVISKQEKVIIAYHEAGHAVAGWFLENCNPLLKISIIPRSQSSLGFSQSLPKEQFLYNTQQLLDHMCMSLAGRAAEELKFGELSTGALDDLQKVTNIAVSQVTEFGMAQSIGHISFRRNSSGLTFEKPYSEATHEAIDKEVRQLIDLAYQRVLALLKERRKELELVAEFLLKHEAANHKDMVTLLGARPFLMDKTQEDIISAAYSFQSTTESAPVPPPQPQPSQQPAA